jgi:hypothetical protein
LNASEKLSKQIPDEDLTLIKIASKNVKETEKSEVWYNGKLYDIATTVIINDTIYYYALEDNKEEETIGLIYEHFNTEFNSTNLQTLKQFFHKTSIKGIYQFYCFSHSEHKQHRGFSFLDYINQNTSCVLGIHKVLTPPPKNISISGFNA